MSIQPGASNRFESTELGCGRSRRIGQMMIMGRAHRSNTNSLIMTDSPSVIRRLFLFRKQLSPNCQIIVAARGLVRGSHAIASRPLGCGSLRCSDGGFSIRNRRLRLSTIEVDGERRSDLFPLTTPLGADGIRNAAVIALMLLPRPNSERQQAPSADRPWIIGRRSGRFLQHRPDLPYRSGGPCSS